VAFTVVTIASSFSMRVVVWWQWTNASMARMRRLPRAEVHTTLPRLQINYYTLLCSAPPRNGAAHQARWIRAEGERWLNS
jgi:hypothetical protein